MKKENKCSVCAEKPARKTRLAWFCEKHFSEHCFVCNAELSAIELARQIMWGREVICVSCKKDNLREEKKLAIEKIENKFNFQIRWQICGDCKKVNDSRNEKGEVTSRFCLNCRQLRGDMSAMKATRPKMLREGKGRD